MSKKDIFIENLKIVTLEYGDGSIHSYRIYYISNLNDITYVADFRYKEDAILFCNEKTYGLEVMC